MRSAKRRKVDKDNEFKLPGTGAGRVLSDADSEVEDSDSMMHISTSSPIQPSNKQRLCGNCRQPGHIRSKCPAILSPLVLASPPDTLPVIEVSIDFDYPQIQDSKDLRLSDVFAEQVQKLITWKLDKSPEKWPSARAKDPEERNLGSWLNAIRRRAQYLDIGNAQMAKGLTTEQITTLTQCIPGWRMEAPDPWEEKLTRLKAWKLLPENDDKWPSRLSTNEDTKMLGAWLSDQRKYARHLDEGLTDPRKIKGMNGERLSLLDSRLPGWRGNGRKRRHSDSEDTNQRPTKLKLASPSTEAQKLQQVIQSLVNDPFFSSPSTVAIEWLGKSLGEVQYESFVNPIVQIITDQGVEMTRIADLLVMISEEREPSARTPQSVLVGIGPSGSHDFHVQNLIALAHDFQTHPFQKSELKYNARRGDGIDRNANVVGGLLISPDPTSLQWVVEWVDTLSKPTLPNKSDDEEEGDAWKNNFTEFVAWKSLHKRWPLYTDKDQHERRLAAWLTRQRQQQKLADSQKPSRLTQEKFDMLNDQLPGWIGTNVAQEKWNRTLNELVAWRILNANKWPRQFGKDLVPGERRMGSWLSDQRRRKRALDGDETVDRQKYKVMTVEELRMLDSSVPGWQGVERVESWMGLFAQLKSWRDEHKSWPNHRAVQEGERIIGRWLVDQIKAHRDGKMMPEQLAKLDEVADWKTSIPIEEERVLGTDQFHWQTHIQRYLDDQVKIKDEVEPQVRVPSPHFDHVGEPTHYPELLKECFQAVMAFDQPPAKIIQGLILEDNYAYVSMLNTLLLNQLQQGMINVSDTRQEIVHANYNLVQVLPSSKPESVFLCSPVYPYEYQKEFLADSLSRIEADIAEMDKVELISTDSDLEIEPYLVAQHVTTSGLLGPSHTPMDARLFHAEKSFAHHRVNSNLPYGVMAWYSQKRDVQITHPVAPRLEARPEPKDKLTPIELLATMLWKRVGVMDVVFLDQREKVKEVWLRRSEQEAMYGKFDVLSGYTLFSPYRYRIHCHVEMDWKVVRQILMLNGIDTTRPKWFIPGMSATEWKEIARKEDLVNVVHTWMPKFVPICVIHRMDRAPDVPAGQDGFALPLIFHTSVTGLSEQEYIHEDLWAPRNRFATEEARKEYIQLNKQDYIQRVPIVKHSLTFHLDLSDKNDRGRKLRAWMREQTDQRGRFPSKVFYLHFLLARQEKMGRFYEGRLSWDGLIDKWDAEELGCVDISVKAWGGQSLGESERRIDRKAVTWNEKPACKEVSCPGNDVDNRVTVI
jgi:hypothetical protein